MHGIILVYYNNLENIQVFHTVKKYNSIFLKNIYYIYAANLLKIYIREYFKNKKMYKYLIK